MKSSKKKKYNYKSGFESLFAKNLKEEGIPFTYEEVKYPYIIKRKYVLDFELSDGILRIETKGYFKAEDRTKLLAVKESHPNIDIRLLFMHNGKVHKKSEMRYGDWCDKHGFKWHVSREGFLPKEWIDELTAKNKRQEGRGSSENVGRKT